MFGTLLHFSLQSSSKTLLFRAGFNVNVFSPTCLVGQVGEVRNLLAQSQFLLAPTQINLLAVIK